MGDVHYCYKQSSLFLPLRRVYAAGGLEVYSIVAIVFAGIVYLVVAILLHRYFKHIKKNYFGFWAFWGLALLIAVRHVLGTFYNHAIISWPTYLIGTAFFMIPSVLLVFYLYNSLAKAHEKKMNAALHDQEREYYFSQCQLMQESVKQVKSMRHDMKIHMAAIKGYSEKINADEITSYIDRLYNDIRQSETYSDTGNIMFDSIINFKLKNVVEGNIKLDMKLYVPTNLAVEVVDIVTILGNLLDNAMDAVAGVDEKMIKLDVEYSRESLFIEVQNTFDGIVKYADEGERCIATRKTGDGHGHGLENIRRSVEKYNGHMDVTHADGIFSVSALLYV